MSIDEVISIVVPLAKKMAERTDVGIADISYNGSEHSFVFTLENGDTVHIPFHIVPENIGYENDSLEATNIKSAIDELIELIPTKLSELTNDDNYAKTTDLVNVLDVGSIQADLGSTVFPKITVANAKKIRDDFNNGKNFVVVWASNSAVAVRFVPIYSSNITNQFMAIIHGKVVKYEWASDALDNVEISPTFVNLEKYIHTINVSASTAVGVWKYQFQFENADSSTYSMLYNIASVLYTNYRDVRIPASGTYTENGNVYIVVSVMAVSANQVAVELRKLSDGSLRTIETGAVPVTDSIH